MTLLVDPNTPCNWCEKPIEDFQDDLGEFVINPFAYFPKLEGITCRECHDYGFGRYHIERYGLGER